MMYKVSIGTKPKWERGYKLWLLRLIGCLIVCVLGIPNLAYTQCKAFDRIIRLGKKSLEEKDYLLAIRRFLAAQNACPERLSEANSLIESTFELIDADRIKAEEFSQKKFIEAELSQISALVSLSQQNPKHEDGLLLRSLAETWSRVDSLKLQVPTNLVRELSDRFYDKYLPAHTLDGLLNFEVAGNVEKQLELSISEDHQYIMGSSYHKDSIFISNGELKLFTITGDPLLSFSSQKYGIEGSFVPGQDRIITRLFDSTDYYVTTAQHQLHDYSPEISNTSLWDFRHSQVSAFQSPLCRTYHKVIFPKNGNKLFTVGGFYADTLFRWDVNGNFINYITPYEVYDKFSPDGELIVQEIESKDFLWMEDFKEWSIIFRDKEGNNVRKFAKTGFMVELGAFSPKGGVFYTVEDPGWTLFYWRLDLPDKTKFWEIDGKKLFSFSSKDEYWSEFRFIPNSDLLLVELEDKMGLNPSYKSIGESLCIVDPKIKEEDKTLVTLLKNELPGQNKFKYYEFSPDGKLLFVRGEDSVRVLNLQAEILCTIKDSGAFKGFLSDGKLLMFYYESTGELSLRQTTKGEPLRKFTIGSLGEKEKGQQ